MALVINLIFTIWAVLTYGVNGGLGILHDGSCKKASTLTFWIHLAINVLSTLLLGASNYSMQCLSSPTRNEIDKAHSKGIWLDIGVPSVRNLLKLSAYRVVLWWLLAISSIPLHLLWNSAVFSSLCSREYSIFVVSKEWMGGAPIIYSMRERNGLSLHELDFSLLGKYQENQTSLTKVENKACLDAYSSPFISAYSDLILVSNYSNATNSLVGYDTGQGLSLLYGERSSFFVLLMAGRSSLVLPMRFLPILTIGRSTLSTIEVTVDYCLAHRVQEHCKLQFSVTIMIVVIVCNLVKAICMGVIAWKQDQQPLVTLGDAIASFLRQPDMTTAGRCVADKAGFPSRRSWTSLESSWTLTEHYWFQAGSKRRWIASNIL